MLHNLLLTTLTDTSFGYLATLVEFDQIILTYFLRGRITVQVTSCFTSLYSADVLMLK